MSCNSSNEPKQLNIQWPSSKKILQLTYKARYIEVNWYKIVNNSYYKQYYFMEVVLQIPRFTSFLETEVSICDVSTSFSV